MILLNHDNQQLIASQSLVQECMHNNYNRSSFLCQWESGKEALDQTRSGSIVFPPHCQRTAIRGWIWSMRRTTRRYPKSSSRGKTTRITDHDDVTHWIRNRETDTCLHLGSKLIGLAFSQVPSRSAIADRVDRFPRELEIQYKTTIDLVHRLTYTEVQYGITKQRLFCIIFQVDDSIRIPLFVSFW